MSTYAVCDKNVRLKNHWRSLRPDIFVAYGVCTHLGCSVAIVTDPFLAQYRPDTCGQSGCFHCPCHGSTYDLAGRVVKNVPAPRNLVVPDYDFPDEHTLRLRARTDAYKGAAADGQPATRLVRS